MTAIAIPFLIVLCIFYFVLCVVFFFLTRKFLSSYARYFEAIGCGVQAPNFFIPFLQSYVKLNYKGREILGYLADHPYNDTKYVGEFRIKLSNRSALTLKTQRLPSHIPNAGDYELKGNYLVYKVPEEKLPNTNEKAKQLLEELCDKAALLEQNNQTPSR